jgi:hypothetical protein
MRHLEERCCIGKRLQLREIATQEQQALARLAHSRTAPAGRVNRAQVVLAAVHGMPVEEIAARYHVVRHTVYLWLHWFEQQGMEGLKNVLPFALTHPRFEFVFQPKYAAYLNLIEPWWKILCSLALKGRRLPDLGGDLYCRASCDGLLECPSALLPLGPQTASPPPSATWDCPATISCMTRAGCTT